MRKRDANSNVFPGFVLPACAVLWVIFAECHIIFDEAWVLMQVEGRAATMRFLN